MKKIFYFLAAVGITWGVVSCDNEPKNPGDFSIKPELSVSDMVSQTTGTAYPLNVSKTIDSIFGSNITVYDTIWDDNGDYVDRTSSNVWVPSKFTTHYVEFEPITVSAMPDTFAIKITTNAKWNAPQPSKPRGGSQFYTITTSGGGNGSLIFRSEINENATRKVAAELNIYTSDSTVYYKVPLLQEGLAN